MIVLKCKAVSYFFTECNEVILSVLYIMLLVRALKDVI